MVTLGTEEPLVLPGSMREVSTASRILDLHEALRASSVDGFENTGATATVSLGHVVGLAYGGTWSPKLEEDAIRVTQNGNDVLLMDPAPNEVDSGGAASVDMADAQMGVGDSTGLAFPEPRGTLVRDWRKRIRVTYQLVRATSTGLLDDAAMAAIRAEFEALRPPKGGPQ